MPHLPAKTSTRAKGQSSMNTFALPVSNTKREPGPVYSLRLSQGGVLGPNNDSNASTER